MINAIQNFIQTQRVKRYMRKVATSPQWLKHFSNLDAEGLVQLIEPGAKSNFLQQNSASYFDLEHRYGVHVWVYAAVNVIAEKSAVPKLVAKGRGRRNPRQGVTAPETEHDSHMGRCEPTAFGMA